MTRSSRSESSRPEATTLFERVELSCDSWDQFEQLFRRKLESQRVFVPSVQPPPVGAQLELMFSIPDGTSITMLGRVVSSLPPEHLSEPTSAERAGMIVEFGKFARAEEQRVRALLATLEEQDRLSGLGPDSLPAVPPPRAPSTPSRSPTVPPDVPSLPPIITLRPALPRTGNSLPARARHRSPEVGRIATEAYVHAQRDHVQLGDSPRKPQHEASAPRSQRAVRHEDDAALGEAVRMIELRRYPDAIRLLASVLSTDPDKRSAQLWLNLAGARHARAIGELQIAADCYRAVLELQPDHPEAAHQLRLLPPPRPNAPPLGPPTSLLARLIGRKR